MSKRSPIITSEQIVKDTKEYLKSHKIYQCYQGETGDPVYIPTRRQAKTGVRGQQVNRAFGWEKAE